MKKYLSLSLVTLFLIGCGGSGDNTAASTALTATGHNQDVLGVELTVDTPETNSETLLTPSEESTVVAKSSKTALSNTGTAVKRMFNGYELEVVSSKVLEENEETSQSTIAVYGTVNGDKTKSLLKLNTNYVGSTISVAVYKDEVLVAQSETFQVSDKSSINFGEISIN